MKKVILTLMLLVTLLAVFVACTTPTETTAEKTTTDQPASSGTATSSDEPNDPGVTTPPESQPTQPEGDVVKTDDYTAVLNDAAWTPDSIDTSAFQFSGSGTEVMNKINLKYNNGAKRVYHNASGETYTTAQIRKLPSVGAVVTESEDGTLDVLIVEMNVRIQMAWKSVTARAGSYLMFEFTTNMDATFATTVTKSPEDSQKSAAYTQGGITVKGENGTFTGIAKCTVPYSEGETFYINICMDGGSYPVVASIPVSVTTAKYPSEFSLIFQGDWELVKSKEYLPDLVDLFYNSYPRLYARFALGNAPKQITFMADKNYDGVAYCSGTTVCVSVDYANQAPKDLGFFSHEITHSVQQYEMLNYGEGSTYEGKTLSAWWTESMATYGGFRYFHWGYSTKFVQIYDVNHDPQLRNFQYEGDGCKWFFAYLDFRFPTTDKNNDGKITADEYGLVDLINYTIKTSEVKFTDNPWDPSTPFNKAVYTATGGQYKCIDEVNQQFAKDCENGSFVFTGFRDYQDNFITEDLDGIPNPDYPMLEKVAKGDKTNPILGEAVLEGTSVLGNATFVEYSGALSRNPITNIIDGKLDNRWQSGKDSIGNYKYELMGFKHGFVIDLGSEKTFDTYTLVTAGYEEANDSHNVKEWEILVSNDGRTWTSVDYQKDNKADVVSVNIGSQTARYVEVRFFTSAQQSASDTIRLNEFMLFE